MATSYTLDQYVNDLRAITATETDPVKITDLDDRFHETRVMELMI